MKLSLVNALDSDFEFLLNLRMKTMDEHLRNAGLFLTLEQHSARVKDKFQLSHIILAGTQRVGFIKFENSASNIVIHQFQVLSEHQGKGYGREVLNHILSNGHGKVVCLTALKQNPAYRLYKSLGFIKVGEDTYEYHLECKTR